MRRAVELVLLAAAVVVFSATMLRDAARGAGYDLVPVAIAGRLASTGRLAHLYSQHPEHYNLVDDPVFRNAAREVGFSYEPTPFVYPPLVAVLAGPAGDVRFASLKQGWAMVSVGLTLAGLAFTLALYQRPRPRLMTLSAVLLALCAFEPLRYGFWLGQTTALVFPLVMAAALLQRRGRVSLAAFALSLASFVKLTPIVLVVVWLWLGPRRAAAYTFGWLAALWGLSLGLAGVDPHVAYVRRVAAIGESVVVAFNNHSLLAFLSRASFPESAWTDWTLRAPDVLAALSTAVILGGSVAPAALWLRRLRTRDPDATRAAAEGLALIAMLLAPAIAWTHYFVFLLPVAAVVFHTATTSLVWARAIAVLSVMLCCRPLLPPQDAVITIGGALRIGAPTIAALSLGTVLLAAVRRRAAPEPAVEVAATLG